MSRLKRGGRNPLLGRVNSDVLRGAAKEILAHADQNTKRTEWKRKHEHQYDERPTEIGFIEEKLSDGRWRLYSVQDIHGMGLVDVTRELRENLLPAARMDLIRKVGRAGIANTFEEARDYVLYKLELRVVDSYTSGKVK